MDPSLVHFYFCVEVLYVVSGCQVWLATLGPVSSPGLRQDRVIEITPLRQKEFDQLEKGHRRRNVDVLETLWVHIHTSCMRGTVRLCFQSSPGSLTQMICFLYHTCSLPALICKTASCFYAYLRATQR